MTNPLTTLTASAISTLAFQKLFGSGVGELGKKFTEVAIKKMTFLQKTITNRLQGRSEKLDSALLQAGQRDEGAISISSKYLDLEMEEQPDFAQEIQDSRLIDNSNMEQNNYGNSQGWQTKVEGGIAYIGEIHQHGSSTSSNS